MCGTFARMFHISRRATVKNWRRSHISTHILTHIFDAMKLNMNKKMKKKNEENVEKKYNSSDLNSYDCTGQPLPVSFSFAVVLWSNDESDEKNIFTMRHIQYFVLSNIDFYCVHDGRRSKMSNSRIYTFILMLRFNSIRNSHAMWLNSTSSVT